MNRITVTAGAALLVVAVLPTAAATSALLPTCNGLSATKVGTTGADVLSGTIGDDVIVGLGGNDTINGLVGNDTICGGKGNDTINGGAGSDTILGSDGSDKLNGGLGSDRLYGGSGGDRLVGGGGDDKLFGQSGSDVLFADGTDIALDGGADRDIADFSLAAGSVMVDLSTSSVVVAGRTFAAISLEDVVGSRFADVLVGTDGVNRIDGGKGEDRVSGGGGGDLLLGEDGNDRLVGGAGDDLVSGGPGTDSLLGGAGSDTCALGETPIGCERSDVSAPVLVSLGRSPASVDVSLAAGEVTFEVRMTDNLAGVDMGHIVVRSPSGGQEAWVEFRAQNRVSGDELDGVYRAVLTIPRYAEAGTWVIGGVFLSDQVPNQGSMSGAALAGMPTIEVTGS